VSRKPSSRLRSSSVFTALAVVRKLLHWPVDVWINRPVLDLLLGGTASCYIVDHQDVLGQVPNSTWPTWYQTLAGAAGGLLGLGTVAVTLLYVVTNSARLEQVRAHLGHRLQRDFVGCMIGLLIGLGGFSLLFAVQRGLHTAIHDGVLVGLICLCGLRAARMFWLFSRVVLVLGVEDPAASNERSIEPASHVWQRPAVGEHDYARRPR
jgi:hypothetical protein